MTKRKKIYYFSTSFSDQLLEELTPIKKHDETRKYICKLISNLSELANINTPTMEDFIGGEEFKKRSLQEIVRDLKENYENIDRNRFSRKTSPLIYKLLKISQADINNYYKEKQTDPDALKKTYRF